MRLHKVVEVKDSRGNRTRMASKEFVEVRGAVVPDRSSRAEVPGQMEINILRVIIPSNLPNVEIWSRIEFLGRWWEPVSPPEPHFGDRHTNHWSMLIRLRPDDGGHLEG